MSYSHRLRAPSPHVLVRRTREVPLLIYMYLSVYLSVYLPIYLSIDLYMFSHSLFIYFYLISFVSYSHRLRVLSPHALLRHTRECSSLCIPVSIFVSVYVSTYLSIYRSIYAFLVFIYIYFYLVIFVSYSHRLRVLSPHALLRHTRECSSPHIPTYIGQSVYLSSYLSIYGSIYVFLVFIYIYLYLVIFVSYLLRRRAPSPHVWLRREGMFLDGGEFAG